MVLKSALIPVAAVTPSSTAGGAGDRMLATSPVTTILPVVDADRARDFYDRVLGLRYAGVSGDGKHLFAISSGTLALLKKPEPTKAEHTALSFEVGDVADAVRELTGRGVLFDDYDLPGLKTVDKVCILGSEKAAWFKDTEGNILCVHETIR
jgi:catechol 2,3-dioxygenase-like lactoylglutathione lyase family enzyme